MKKFFALLLALVMSLSLVACGGGDTANEDTSTDDTATEENGGDTATASDVEIAVVLKTLASEYWGYVKAGCDAAAADLGVTVNVVGPGAESEIEQQVSMIEKQIGAGCDAIIVAPNDAGAASGALASAIGSIPVLSVDTNVGIEGQTSFVGTSNVDAAKEGGLWAAEQAGEGANAVIIYGQEGDNTSNMRREGYQAACDEAGVTVLDALSGQNTTDGATKTMEDLLIFPEGTRVEHEGALPAKGGVAVIGIRSGAQFVPVYVEGNKRLFRRTRIIFGQAYRPEATSRRPSPEEVQAIADEVLRRSYALGKEAR